MIFFFLRWGFFIGDFYFLVWDLFGLIYVGDYYGD